MFTENEVAALINFPGIKEETEKLKERFIKEEAEFLEISDHDFLSLVLITPSIGLALANGSVSLFEEMALNKKARKLSKGGYWMKKDPVVFAMEYLIDGFDKWSSIFYEYIRFLIQKTVHINALNDPNFKLEESTEENQGIEVFKSPFIIIRYLTSFFMDDEEEDILAERKISRIEYDKVVEIADKLGISYIPIYQIYRSRLIIK